MGIILLKKRLKKTLTFQSILQSFMQTKVSLNLVLPFLFLFKDSKDLQKCVSIIGCRGDRSTVSRNINTLRELEYL